MAQTNDNIVRWNYTTNGKLIDNRREYLKCIAIITMVLDHIGMIFFPQVLALRMVGRIAFPIYAYLMATGIDWTDNKFRYFLRLAVIAALAQYGFALFVSCKFNIVFTFAIFILVYQLWQSGHKAIAVFLGLCTALVEYSIYGLLLLFVFRLLETHKVKGIIFYIALTLLYSSITNNPVQIFAILALPVIYLCPKNFKLQIPNWLWRWFYPAHFFVLLGVKLLCVN